MKYDAGKYGGSLSVFNTSKQSSIVEDNVFSTDGEQQNQGLELSVFGMPTSNLRVLGGFTWLDAEMTKTQDGTLDGKTAIGVPDLQANINLDGILMPFQGLLSMHVRPIRRNNMPVPTIALKSMHLIVSI